MIETGPRGVLFARGLATALPGARIERVAVPRWGYVHYLLPGLIAFTVMISGLFGMSHPLLKYREVQFLKKLSLAPLSRVTFVLAQVLARSALSFGQMALVLAAAWWLFDLPLDLGRAAAMLAVVFLGLTVFMAVGFALACVLPTEAAMTDVVGAVTTPMVLLLEMFFPSSELPPPLRAVAVWLPSTQMVSMGSSPPLDAAPTAHTLAPCAAVLLAWPGAHPRRRALLPLERLIAPRGGSRRHKPTLDGVG